MRVVVLADTHLRPGRARDLPAAAWREIDRAGAIIHAGDVLTGELLDELREVAPTYAVLGNNDRDLVGVLPERLELELGGVRIAVVHEAGARAGRPERVHRWFPDAALVVYGHSHEPFDGVGVDGQRLFNPGSPTQRRRAPHHTIGRLDLRDGRITRHEIVELRPRIG